MMNRPLPHDVQQHAQWQRQEQQRHEQRPSHDTPAKSGDNPVREQPRPAPHQPAAFQPSFVPAKTPVRPVDKQRLSRDESEFTRLLNDDQSAAPLMPIGALAHIDPDGLSGKAQETQSTGASQAAALWQIIEPPLSQNLAAQEAFPAHFSLLLPQLGEVNAQVTTLPGGDMHVALGFLASAFEVVRGSERQCAESLARRMGQRMRLRFQRQETLS